MPTSQAAHGPPFGPVYPCKSTGPNQMRVTRIALDVGAQNALLEHTEQAQYCIIVSELNRNTQVSVQNCDKKEHTQLVSQS